MDAKLIDLNFKEIELKAKNIGLERSFNDGNFNFSRNLGKQRAF